MPKIVAHGGVGSHEKVEKKKEFLKSIVENESNHLENNQSAIDTVEKVVNCLESNKEFNAGYGSKIQLDGVPRPEAGIMKDDLSFSSVIGLEKIENPVSVARELMKRSNNNMLAPPFSTYFALSMGFPMRDLVTKRRREEWWELREKVDGLTYKNMIEELRKMDQSSGTVGCVAIDKQNRLCAATSTGGRTNIMAGRIGDSPIIGSGFYCNKEVAISTTGIGEAILKTQLSRRVAENYNGNLDKAVEISLEYLEENTDRYAGIIAVDRNGNTSEKNNRENLISFSSD